MKNKKDSKKEEKEMNLTEKVKKYYYEIGSLNAFLSAGTTFLFVSFFIFNLSFKIVSMICFILVLYIHYDLRKLKIKWIPKNE